MAQMRPSASSASLADSKKDKASVFSTLLRSARKSTESLRSFKSLGHSSEGGKRRGWLADQELDPPPPLPSRSDIRSRDAMTASQSVLSLASSSSQAGILLKSPRQQPHDISSGQGVPRSATQPASEEDKVPPLHSQTESHLSATSREGPSTISKSSHTESTASSQLGSHRKVAVDDDDGAKTPTGRTTPTQGNLRGLYGGVPAVPSKEGDGNTVAQLYIVAGLPKDPSVWTLAEDDCVAGVHHMDGAVGRFWRPEILGCSICPSPLELEATRKSHTAAGEGQSNIDAEKKWEGRTAQGNKSTSNPKFIEMSDGRGRIERAETSKVLSKALKLSFTREIEIVSGQSNYPPAASSHIFSFNVTTQLSVGGSSAFGDPAEKRISSTNTDKRDSDSSQTGVGAGINGAGHQTAGYEDSPSPMTFYGVVLTVWSAADERRTKAIKRELNRANKAQKNKKGSSNGAQNRDDEEREDGFLPANNAFFMPYAICIISKYPLYDLLCDWNKWAWNRYSRNIQKHNQLMSAILATPAPRLGTNLTIDSPEGDVSFSCTFPGALEWGTGQIAVNLTMWPLFKTLSIDNILTICEVALAPNGRILFMSRYPALLGLAVETVKYLIEMCGWKGTALQSCHARDVKIYLEDPGTWLVAIASELRSIIKPASEVCIVDLDINFVKLTRPPKGAPSVKGLREKRRRKLVQALGYSSGDFRPPREYIEAYPGGRFRPLTKMIAKAGYPADEGLEEPIWWNQTQVVAGFDKALHNGTRLSPLAKLLRTRTNKSFTTSEAELAAIATLRSRAETFVDARDGLENKIGRLNKRLAFLMSESEMWKVQFSKISQLVERLTREANDTRAKLDKERRESRRLSSTLAQRDLERLQLEVQLKETEDARTQAQAELSEMQRAMDSLEHEREAMMSEIRGIVSGASGDEDIAFKIGKVDLYSESVGHASGVSSPTGSHASLSHSQAAERILKARKAAEDRINEGRPSPVRSRAPTVSVAHSDVHRDKISASPLPSSLGGHHPSEDQMNYEIQRRTLTVTNQIARIQAQLENTLSSLEDRKSASHNHRSRSGRMRRDSDLSMGSGARSEHGVPSSLGGAHMSHDPELGQGSGGATGYETGTETESVAHEGGYASSTGAAGLSMGSEALHERREARRRRRAAMASPSGGSLSGDTTVSVTSRRRATSNTGPPSAYRGPSHSSLTATSSTIGSSPMSKNHTVPQAKSRDSTWQQQQQQPPPQQQLQAHSNKKENPWKMTSGRESRTSLSASTTPTPLETGHAHAVSVLTDPDQGSTAVPRQEEEPSSIAEAELPAEGDSMKGNDGKPDDVRSNGIANGHNGTHPHGAMTEEGSQQEESNIDVAEISTATPPAEVESNPRQQNGE